MPEAEIPSYRLIGRTQMLTDTLETMLPQENIFLKSKVKSIKQIENRMMLETDKGKVFEADKVIICISPQLVIDMVFSPLLPEELPYHLYSVGLDFLKLPDLNWIYLEK